MAMVDASFLQAYQNILDRRNRGIVGFGDALMGAGATVGTAAIGRKKDADALQAELDAQRQALGLEQGAIAERRFALDPTGPGAVKPEYGPYEAAQREAELADLGTRQSDIQGALGELGKIGPVKFRNVYDVRAPKLPERKATDYSGMWKDVAAGQAEDLERIRALGASGKAQTLAQEKAAEALAKSQAEYNELAGALGKKGPAPTDPTVLAQSIGAMKQQLRKIDKTQSTKPDDGSKLAGGDTTPVATNINVINETLKHIQYGQSNKDKFGRFSGTGEKAKSAITGGGFAETMKSRAKSLAVGQARVRTQGNPTGNLETGDIGMAYSIARDVNIPYDQWLTNQVGVMDEMIGQTQSQIDFLKDGPQKEQMRASLQKVKAERDRLLGQGGTPSQEDPNAWK